jgi:hypothetical protein
MIVMPSEAVKPGNKPASLPVCYGIAQHQLGKPNHLQNPNDQQYYE